VGRVIAQLLASALFGFGMFFLISSFIGATQVGTRNFEILTHSAIFAVGCFLAAIFLLQGSQPTNNSSVQELIKINAELSEMKRMMARIGGLIQNKR
jgi:hypothetical protein